MPSRPKQPSKLKAEKIENPDRAKNTDFSAYQIYAGEERVARLAGTPKSVTLLWSGELENTMWLPENLPSIGRLVLPEQTEKLSDEQVMQGSQARVIASGKAVGHGLAAIEAGPKGRVPMDWNLRSKEDFERYGQLLTGKDATFSALRIDLCIDGIQGMFSFVPGPADEAVQEGADQSRSGGFSLHRDPSLPWCTQTVDFIKHHHGSAVISGMDLAQLQAQLTATSRAIAGIAAAPQALS